MFIYSLGFFFFCHDANIHTISWFFILKCAHTYTIKFIRVQFTLSHILLFESQKEKKIDFSFSVSVRYSIEKFIYLFIIFFFEAPIDLEKNI
jgi:hypothetical protein